LSLKELLILSGWLCHPFFTRPVFRHTENSRQRSVCNAPKLSLLCHPKLLLHKGRSAQIRAGRKIRSASLDQPPPVGLGPGATCECPGKSTSCQSFQRLRDFCV